MKILLCSPEIPFPMDSGLKVRAFNLARALARRHEVHLFCLSRSPVDRSALKVLSDEGMIVHVLEKPAVSLPMKVATYLRRLARGTPLPYILSWEDAIFARLWALESEQGFDAVIAEHLFMARYVLKLNCPKVMADQNVEWELAAQLAITKSFPAGWWKRLEAAWIRSYERKMLGSVQCVIAVSADDKDKFMKLAPGIPVVLVGNGVDTGRYLELYEAQRPVRQQLLFLGLMSYQPNEEAAVWFTREVLPLIAERYPQTVFIIAGAGPSARVSSLDDGVTVKVTGAAADVKPLYRDAGVMVVPLNFGGGSRLKILEAFAAGTPVVSTAKGAEGLEVEDGRHLLMADSPRELAAAIVRLYEDDRLYAQLRENARRLVEEKYDWSVQAEPLEEALLRALAR